MSADAPAPQDVTGGEAASKRSARRVALGVMAVALTAGLVTLGDLGVTWDEPSYRESQVVSAKWWKQLARVRSTSDLAAVLDPDVLLYYWPYGRFGINFHPPLAGQLNQLTYSLFHPWMKDMPARRMASAIELALTAAILAWFVTKRYGPWAGSVAGLALVLMPRVFGDGHMACTDMPGLLLWVSTTLACWKGLYEPNAGRWRVLVGILVGLAFVEKMAAVLVVAPLLFWIGASGLIRRPRRADWIDGIVTLGAMLIPLGLAYLEIKRLATLFPPPGQTNLMVDKPPSALPAWILLIPLAVWLVRRILGRVLRGSSLRSVERPALETVQAILAFGPVFAWFGNPAWWRETLPRLAHYYIINDNRRGALPDIQILYFGQVYEYSLPWHNAWVLMAITVPASILIAAAIGLLWSLGRIRSDRLPLYILIHLAMLPVMRMLPTPGHDGVRLFLPTFAFLAVFAGWGVRALAGLLARGLPTRSRWIHALTATAVLGPASWQLISVHPFELSYYNEFIGGPAGAWKRGFELAYWFDAYNARTLKEINERLPRGATVDFTNVMSMPPTFLYLQELGHLREDIVLGSPDPRSFPYRWLLTQDSKTDPQSRLLFAMGMWYESRPRQLQGSRVAAVADPVAASRAWALALLLDDRTRRPEKVTAPLPGWLRTLVPILPRFWGEGLTLALPLRVNEETFRWAETDPEGLRAAARDLAAGRPETPDTHRLRAILTHMEPAGQSLEILLKARPQALVEAVEILIRRPEELRHVLLRYPYTDPSAIGGPLDRDLRSEPPS